ncbi:Na+/H+ antiporter subunit D [Salinibacter ruber]|uniref:Na+/H+ antiporter subunit D n=1 Tax=Salinibacter ruber TaxID=146919 RepID=UPI002168FC19|nr:Na+/H+ antiporter subunit D [Salinibacter ruber]MCS3696607.1 multicomponent Na+:H+ antiporter subunit D [Salinibacter ruber]
MSAHLLIILPLIIPFVAAVAALLFARWPTVQKGINIVSMGGILAASLGLLSRITEQGIQVTTIGDWPVPFGIVFVVDHLSVVMLIVSAIIGLAVAVYAVPDVDDARVRFGFYPFFNLLMIGINGAFLTGDLFNLYVWFEVMLISSFVLIVLGNTDEQLAGAVKYVVINLVSSLLFLSGVGLVYGMTGTLNMAELSLALSEVGQPGLVTVVAMLFLISFGIKAALFPLFFWLPASYHTPPASVSAFFAGLLTKVGVYALFRVFTLLFTQDVGYTHTLLLWGAGLTMVTGVLGAAVQNDFRRVLSFHIVSQIGYMIMGLALYTPLAILGGVFYIVHHIIVKANLFLVSGVAKRLRGSFSLKSLDGLYAYHPWLATLFIIPAFSLAGFPPLSGFWAKLILTIAGIETGAYWIVAVAVVVGLFTMFSMTKIWVKAFLPGGGGDLADAVSSMGLGMRVMYVPIAGLAALTIMISVFAGPVYDLAERSADELYNSSEYVEAVLNHEKSAADAGPRPGVDGRTGRVHAR